MLHCIFEHTAVAPYSAVTMESTRLSKYRASAMHSIVALIGKCSRINHRYSRAYSRKPLWPNEPNIINWPGGQEQISSIGRDKYGAAVSVQVVGTVRHTYDTYPTVLEERATNSNC